MRSSFEGGYLMKWRKLGLIFAPDNNYPWMVSHAANPVAEWIGGCEFRVYFSCRDNQNRSHIGFVEFDLRRPQKILRIAEQPLVSPGERGYFDDSGASMGCLVISEGKRYLYYLGWNLGVTVPWRNSIGLAVSDVDKLTFQKYSTAPIVDRNEVDPFSLSYPWVIRDGSIWRMWYGSNLGWGKQHSDMKHVIKYAESSDGIRWYRDGIVAIPLLYEEEWGIAKPCVIRNDTTYTMWYSTRQGNTYRIGYAVSSDAIHWQRKDDEVGIDVSESGWDSEMIEYPFVFDHGGKRYMLYNGNGFGRTGFGLAVLDE